MKRLLPCTFLIFFGFGASLIPLPVSAESPVSVDRILFARNIESREPVGAATEFQAPVNQVFCWTRLSTRTPPAAVKHVWYRNGQRLLEVPLTLNFPSGRYWSVKNVGPGAWMVKVEGAKGEVFGSGSFMVK